MDRVPIRFRTKLVLVAAGSVIIGLGASVGVALYAAGRLGDESSSIIADGLAAASHDHLSQAAEQTAQQARLLFGQVAGEVKIAALALQDIVDRDPPVPGASDKLVFDPKLHAFTTPSGAPCTSVLFSYMLKDDKVPDELTAFVRRTSDINLVLAAIQDSGVRKVQTYFVGDEANPFIRMCPWADLIPGLEKLYPGGEKTNFWSFFFPGLVEGWKTWPGGGTLPPLDQQVTLTAPYDDAAGGGTIISFFLPVWTPDRRVLAGAVAIDITLAEVAGYVAGVHLGKSGFAFLAQQSGNVLAVSQAGARTLKLKEDQRNAGLTMLERPLSGSAAPSVAALKLPTDDGVLFQDVEIDGEGYVVALRRLPAFPHVWTGTANLAPETWTVGLVVPKREIYATLAAARRSIERRTGGIVTGQLATAGVTLALVLLGIALITNRMTQGLGQLADRAGRIMNNDYDVEVSVASRDEMAQLGTAFNSMASQIRKHTAELEKRVADRTTQLKAANEEISLLNDKLKAENVRMGAELDVARRVQLMVLPHARELGEIRELDVVGHMQPATEVGGDYYDVVGGSAGGVSLGIGDVTGHGLESGVLMLMIQTAVRTMLSADETDPARILAVVNKVFYQNVQRINTDHSASLALLHYAGGTLTLTGQHEEAIIVRRGGELERISTMELGFPVGIEFDISAFVTQTRIEIAEGDVVVLFTDGITEAENLAKEQYGVERLCEVVRTHRAAAAREIKNAVLASVTAFIGEQQVFDDITLVIAKRV